MGVRRTEEFRNEGVRISLTSRLSQKKVADDLGIGLSTLGKWSTAHKHNMAPELLHDYFQLPGPKPEMGRWHQRSLDCRGLCGNHRFVFAPCHRLTNQ